MPKPATQLEFLALCFELPDLSDASTPLPEWLPMIPAGTFTGRDGRTWVNDNPQAIIATSFRYPTLPFDAEHSTELLGPKVKKLRLMPGLMPCASTLTAALTVISSGRLTAKRSFAVRSTAITARLSVIPTGQVSHLSSAGLTNKPNLYLPALNSENTMPVPVQIATALGLAETASLTMPYQRSRPSKTANRPR
jgi:hypothetical protein